MLRKDKKGFTLYYVSLALFSVLEGLVGLLCSRVFKTRNACGKT